MIFQAWSAFDQDRNDIPRLADGEPPPPRTLPRKLGQIHMSLADVIPSPSDGGMGSSVVSLDGLFINFVENWPALGA